MKILAIIPARGGSKGVPKKNIKPLAGKPLIFYTIGEARNQCFTTNQTSRKNGRLNFCINNEMTQKDKTTFSEPCRICGVSDWEILYRGPIRTGKFGEYSKENHVVWKCSKCQSGLYPEHL